MAKAEKNYEERLLKIRELSEILGFGMTKTREIVKQKNFPVLLIGKSQRFLKSQVLKWCNSQVKERRTVKTLKDVKRQNGDGSIFKNKEGFWTAQISFRDANGKLCRPKKTRCKTEAEAKRELKELWKNAENNGYISSGDTLESLIVAVINKKKMTVWYNERLGTFTSSYNKAMGFLNGFISDYNHIMKKHSQKVKYSDINSIIETEIEKGVNNKSIREKLNLIKEAFEHQIRLNNGKGNNPAAYVEVPKKYMGKKNEIRSYSEDELSKLIPIAEKHFRWHVWALLLYMGLRPGEVMALKWEDIDFTNGAIKIDKAVDSRLQKIKETKTGKERTLKILNVLRPILIKAKLKYSNEHQYVAYNQKNDNKPIERRNLHRQWSKICEKAGVNDTAVYSLRHTFATLAEKNGIDKEYIAAYMGHSNTITTEGYIDNYSEKTANKNISKAAEMLDKMQFVSNF